MLDPGRAASPARRCPSGMREAAQGGVRPGRSRAARRATGSRRSGRAGRDSAARCRPRAGARRRRRHSTVGRIAAARMKAKKSSADEEPQLPERERAARRGAHDERRDRGPLGGLGHREAVSPASEVSYPLRTHVRTLEWRPNGHRRARSSTGPGSTTSRTSTSGCRGTRWSASPGCPDREVSPRLRHDLRRGPAPLRREPLRVRAPVPADDGEARRRLDRRALAGDLDRPEDDLAQPALDGRHRHRDLRLPAPALRARRPAALPGLRPADRGAVPRPDRRADPARCPRARGSRSTRRSCATARASSATCSRSCAPRASRASRSTARCACSRRRSSSTRSSSTRSRWSSTGS